MKAATYIIAAVAILAHIGVLIAIAYIAKTKNSLYWKCRKCNIYFDEEGKRGCPDKDGIIIDTGRQDQMCKACRERCNDECK